MCMQKVFSQNAQDFPNMILAYKYFRKTDVPGRLKGFLRSGTYRIGVNHTAKVKQIGGHYDCHPTYQSGFHAYGVKPLERWQNNGKILCLVELRDITAVGIQTGMTVYVARRMKILKRVSKSYLPKEK